MGACASQPKTADDCPKRLRAGQEVSGGLRVVRPLGAGSWASIYLVERTVDGRKYALKRTAIHELSDAERWIAVNEVRLLASLHHPNVVDYKQCSVEDGCLHVVMEVVPHGDLTDVIKKHHAEGRSISEDAIWGYLLQIAVGLQFLHASGVIHRDIKPANVLLGEGGVLKIADLGVAGLLPKGNSKLQIGTAQYMAPEMHAGHEYTFGADVWSLGCLVHELCTLQPLFNDPSEDAVAKKVMATTLPPAIPSRYSPELQIMINRMLQRDPARRPSVREILNSQQLQSRMHLLPTDLERSLTSRNISLDCMEGVPVLPAIEVPADLSQLNQRLPRPRYSFDAPDLQPSPKGQHQRPADPHLPRIASPVTVLEDDVCSPCPSSALSVGGSTTGGSMRVINAVVASALAAEKQRQGAEIESAAGIVAVGGADI